MEASVEFKLISTYIIKYTLIAINTQSFVLNVNDAIKTMITHPHTHTHTHIYIYIYIYRERERDELIQELHKFKETKEQTHNHI